jgi:hypothetical protein
MFVGQASIGLSFSERSERFGVVLIVPNFVQLQLRSRMS